VPHARSSWIVQQLLRSQKKSRNTNRAGLQTRYKAKNQHSTFESMQLFIFAVETSGGLNKEARDFVKRPAKTVWRANGSVLQCIYQATNKLCNLRTDQLHISTGRVHKLWAQHSTLAVEIQNARVHQVNIAKRRYPTSTASGGRLGKKKCLTHTHTHTHTSSYQDAV
jgi:hypothetical protein